MKVWHGLENIPLPFPTGSVAVGTFDGLHVGHQALIRAAVADAAAHGRPSVVFTFDRHPAEIIAPAKAPPSLSTLDQRVALLSDLGIDHLVIARFDERFRELSPEAFLRFVVAGVLGARAVFVGQDFRFGRNQQGDVAYLADGAERYGYALHVVPAVMVGAEKASSSRVRALVAEGSVEEAAAVLGRPYVLRGVVVEGQRLGRTLGYPTANLRPEGRLAVPADGIYAAWAHHDGERYRAACSIGVRPTVNGKDRTIEAYLLDYSGDLYGQTLELAFVARLREERKFESLDALKAQMALDVEQTRGLLGS